MQVLIIKNKYDKTKTVIGELELSSEIPRQGDYINFLNDKYEQVSMLIKKVEWIFENSILRIELEVW